MRVLIDKYMPKHNYPFSTVETVEYVEMDKMFDNAIDLMVEIHPVGKVIANFIETDTLPEGYELVCIASLTSRIEFRFIDATGRNTAVLFVTSPSTWSIIISSGCCCLQIDCIDNDIADIRVGGHEAPWLVNMGETVAETYEECIEMRTEYLRYKLGI